MKGNRSHPGFELVSPCPFPITITITPRVPPSDEFIIKESQLENILVLVNSKNLKNSAKLCASNKPIVLDGLLASKCQN